MSKSLKRVINALREAGLDVAPVELGDCRSAADAAAACGCTLDQIAKSIVFGLGDGCGLFLTAGGNQVDRAKASALAGTGLVRADAGMVRRVTGFAIGGVSPLGHLAPSPVWMDRRLLDFEVVWAAAGTPRHVFPINPMVLQRVTQATLADFT
ncbi:Cys-tRNA(Pro) deacylase, prolyl-tRNA editing enzyme YbaK/EbsC [Jannaschia faecimaris]|uniref:Cys-tRNA(Pro) deacylase, prolyl-tRNA editing enzyme YbaK/EbsC n=1 Tax=Jannaschia faecimaris TaxID=1244108 RepID=A0A1H3NUA0_9RHOB|nr:YbaK/EbsC family protein [Jannaschia faecimaris]SDY92517.1 Cys-tRNA(Pro) deacylase, prolyl-tRNA editing enzyme YbaK/EbsC [Jannaschia faecimaris]